jgi:hypothetical protein
VGNVMAQTATQLEAAWKAESVVDALEAWLTDASAQLLIELYPQAKSVLVRPPPQPSAASQGRERSPPPPAGEG